MLVATKTDNKTDAIHYLHDHFNQGLDELDHRTEHINILIIEDDDHDYRATMRALQMMDTFRPEVHRAISVDAARELINGNIKMDVVLADFMLGDETSVAAIAEIGRPVGSSAVILLSGLPGQTIAQVALQAGAISCLNKNDLNPVLLETTIRSALYTLSLEQKLRENIVLLEEASRAKMEFFSRIGHDLKTPLNAILGYSQIITEQAFGAPYVPDKYVNCAENIQTGGAHLLQILNNIILHSANEGKSSEEEMRPCDLNEVVESAVILAEIFARSRAQDIQFIANEETIFYDCKAASIRQAVLNVLTNAIKYSTSGSTVMVSVETTSRGHEIAILDQGIGMSSDDVETARKPFGRVNLPPDLAQDGTGIGLPIVIDIVETHGGTVLIDSEKSKGTKVTLRLPFQMNMNDASHNLSAANK